MAQTVYSLVPASQGRCRRRTNQLNEALHAPVAQLDRALPSEGKAKSSALWGTLEKIEENQAIGETRRKHENRIRGRGSTTEAAGRKSERSAGYGFRRGKPNCPYVSRRCSIIACPSVHFGEPGQIAPKAKVTRSNRVGCASFFLFYSAICALGLKVQLRLVRVSKQIQKKNRHRM